MASWKCVESGKDISDIEKGIRNSFKWFWLDEECNAGRKFNTWCKKLDEPGKCVCIVCSKTINYSSSGKKALKIHAESSEHVSRTKSALMSSKLVSSSDGDQGISKQSLQDRCAEVKATIGLFISEHCLPFTLAPELLSLAQRLSKDTVALNSVTLSATSATYSTTHGVAQHIKESISEKLKTSFFSLNIDEATTAGGNKVMNVLVQFYDEEEKRCVVDLLGSKQVNLANSENLLSAVNGIYINRERFRMASSHQCPHG